MTLLPSGQSCHLISKFGCIVQMFYLKGSASMRLLLTKQKIMSNVECSMQYSYTRLPKHWFSHLIQASKLIYLMQLDVCFLGQLAFTVDNQAFNQDLVYVWQTGKSSSWQALWPLILSWIPTQLATAPVQEHDRYHIKEPFRTSQNSHGRSPLVSPCEFVPNRTRAKNGKVMCRKLGYHFWNFLMFTLNSASETKKSKVLRGKKLKKSHCYEASFRVRVLACQSPWRCPSGTAARISFSLPPPFSAGPWCCHGLFFFGINLNVQQVKYVLRRTSWKKSCLSTKGSMKIILIDNLFGISLRSHCSSIPDLECWKTRTPRVLSGDKDQLGG